MVKAIIAALAEAGGRPFFVGGCVRDAIMGIPPKDVDIEVYGIGADKIIAAVQKFGTVDMVGASFGIIKLATSRGDFDLSLPRRENKSGKGHKGFMVECDPTMTVREAAARRDFTFNAMAQNAITGQIVDEFNGINDMRDGIIRHTSEHFSEDPLRVLRGFQFAGRFGWFVADETAWLCHDLLPEYGSLARERIWGEWDKWATKSTLPSYGLRFLLQTGWIELYPELAALVGTPQDPEWHPEGDVWEHTLEVTDAMARICLREGISGEEKAVLVLAALCHDLGKPSNTQFESGHIRSRGHEQGGEEPTRSFLGSIGCPMHIVEQVVPLVVRHMAHLQEHSARSIRRLARDIAPATITQLGWVIEADHSGRPPLPRGMPREARALLKMAKEQSVGSSAPPPVVMGRDLIRAGYKPGPEFKGLLAGAYEAQLDGTLDEWRAANGVS